MSDPLSLERAVKLAEKYVGCGDHSCLFVRPTGMATNGGCRCDQRPFFLGAMAELFKSARATLPRQESGESEATCPRCGEDAAGHIAAICRLHPEPETPSSTTSNDEMEHSVCSGVCRTKGKCDGDLCLHHAPAHPTRSENAP